MPLTKLNNQDKTTPNQHQPHPGTATVPTTAGVDQTNYSTNTDPAYSNRVTSGTPQVADNTYSSGPRSGYDPIYGQGVNPQTNRKGDGGGFISQSHAERLSREGELRRQQQDQYTNSDDVNAMGFDSPPTRRPGDGEGGNTVPLNSLSLRDQAERTARKSEAMQKQAVEVEKAEELEKQAMAARQHAVEHGAHPLHGQPGGIQNVGRGSQA